MTEEKLTQEQTDEKLIDEAFQELLDQYLKSKHRKKVEIITKAFNFARQAHKGVRRRSGEPYILHPIAVARIACVEIGLGSTSICSALLHDVVEDTDYTVEDIENLFGPKIAQIVDGLTKISGGIFGDRASAQAENFKKLLLTMNDDIRVILIKIADRLHNMRTLGSMLPSKQYKIELYEQYEIQSKMSSYIRCRIVDDVYLFVYCKDYIDIQKQAILCQNKTKLKVIASGKKIYFFPPQIDKGIALGLLKEQFRITKIIAAGDSIIDIPMFGLANCSFTMEKIKDKFFNKNVFYCNDSSLDEFILNKMMYNFYDFI